MAVVDRLQLVQLGKRVPRDLHQLVERGVQELDPLLVLHRDLARRESISSVFKNRYLRFNLRHVAQEVVADIEVRGKAELVEGLRVDVLHTCHEPSSGSVDLVDLVD